MPEEGKDTMTEQEQSLKGGEIDTKSGLNEWESDSLGDQARDIDKLRAQKRREQLARAATPRKTASSKPSIVPWNENMVRPINAQGHYREIDRKTGNVIKSPKPR